MKETENTYGYQLLHVYMYNDREIWFFIELLANQLAKRKKANKPILLEYLEKSSSVANIVRLAKRETILKDDIIPTNEDIKKAKRDISEYILTDFLPNL